MTHCCDNHTLRLILRAIFTGQSGGPKPSGHIVLPFLPQELIPIIADFTTGSIGQLVHRLWNSRDIQRAYARRSEFQLNDNTPYFLDKVLELSRGDWTPSVEDMLRVRVRTTGYIPHDVTIDGRSFRLCDLGGQRGMR